MKTSQDEKYLSKCCNALVKVDLSPDFIGDNPKKKTYIGTCNFFCTKCKKACDYYLIEDKKK